MNCCEITKKVLTNNEASSMLVASVLGTVSSFVAAQLSSAESLSRTVREIRHKNNPVPPNPRKSILYVIPDKFQMTLKNVNSSCMRIFADYLLRRTVYRRYGDVIYGTVMVLLK